MTQTPYGRKLPWGLGLANRVVVALQRLGLAFGPMRLLSVPGRRSGVELSPYAQQKVCAAGVGRVGGR